MTYRAHLIVLKYALTEDNIIELIGMYSNYCYLGGALLPLQSYDKTTTHLRYCFKSPLPAFYLDLFGLLVAQVVLRFKCK